LSSPVSHIRCAELAQLWLNPIMSIEPHRQTSELPRRRLKIPSRRLTYALLAMIMVLVVGGSYWLYTPRTCDISGSWAHSTTDVGQATWIFTPIGGNRYNAREIGLGNATGTAVLEKDRLRIDWAADNSRGYYEWNLDSSCASGTGKLVFLFSSGGSGIHSSSLTRLKLQTSGGAMVRDRS